MQQMKIALTALMLFISISIFAQSNDESDLQKISAKIFRWEVQGKFDSLANTLADRLVVLNSAGATQTKFEYLTRLKSGDFVHNDIMVEQCRAIVSDNTGTVTGKGAFNITVNGKRSALHLTYLEVFTRSSSNATWVLLGLHASVIPVSKIVHSTTILTKH